MRGGFGMKFSYQAGTPDLKISPNVTCIQGNFEENVSQLCSFGYDSVELMSTYPKSVDWHKIKSILDSHNMSVSLICTGELGLLGYTLSNPNDMLRAQSLERIKELIDVASFFGVGINIGNTKGQYLDGVPRAETERRAVEGFQELCDYAKPKNVTIAIETGAFFYINFLNTCAEAAEVIHKAKRDNLGLMLDIFHLYIEEKNMIEAIKKYTPMCYHVHLADNNRMYPGAGGFDFENILSAFHKSGYDKAFTVEVRQKPDSLTAAREAAKTLVPIFKKVYNRRDK
jgi:sugar phosphate isomerase/epimerase